MNRYQFEKIYAQMKQEFGSIPYGQEDKHAMMLFPMEGNVLKIHRKYPASNSRRMIEAIGLVLFDIMEKYTGETFDTSSFRNIDNERLEHALLMAFDPFTNPDSWQAILEGSGTDLPKPDLSDKAWLRNYYKEPIMCLLRIKDSVDLMLKKNGSDGYFSFIEKYMGFQVKGDDMNFSVKLSG